MERVSTALLIVHGLVAVALLGAITHQALATFAPSGAQAGSFFARMRGVPADGFANTVVVLYVLTAILGAWVYLDFKVDISPLLERDRHWRALGFLDLKEDFVSIGLGLLPAYWVCWRRQSPERSGGARAALTALLGFVVWWGFLTGHVLNDIMGFGS